jgi:hypothetical protein
VAWGNARSYSSVGGVCNRSVDCVHAGPSRRAGELELTNQASPKRSQRILEPGSDPTKRRIFQRSGNTSNLRSDQTVAKTPRIGLRPRAQYPHDGDATRPRGGHRYARRAHRRSDHPFYRKHALYLLAPPPVRFLGNLQSRPRTRCPSVRPVLCGFGDGGVCRGHLPFNLHTDQPEPHGRRSGQTGRSRSTNQSALKHEVTKLIALVSSIADQMGVKTEVDPEVNELKQDVAPEAVLDEIEERKR